MFDPYHFLPLRLHQTSVEIKDTFIYKSTDIATYIIALANDRRISINMTKVQKLLYIIYGAYLRIYGERLLNEHPQAWPYGPVFPTTRNKLLKQELSLISADDIVKEERKKILKDTKLNKVVDFVFNHFGCWNAGQLSEWSHSDGSPWYQTTNRNGFKWGDVIPDHLIKGYFNSIISVKSES
ncbi:hypothetical protein PORCAN_1529 [Porphyromonas crevioricanis JCM 13913]|nr:hypothetical protein PORCAN_1529 [Porphyromonas crevioricanis JCM 13913]